MSMLFKNIVLLRLSEEATQAAINAPFEEKLAENPLREIGPLEMSVHGFVSPLEGTPDPPMVHTLGNYTLFTVGGFHRLLPGSVVNEAVKAKVTKIENEEQRKVSRKERQSLKDEVITDLMPRAFVKSSRANAYLDGKEGWVVINASSAKSAEAMGTAVREALGTFPATPLAPEDSPRILMTEWVNSGTLPDKLILGDACELKDPSDSPAATARVRNQDLDSDEIREHLKAGKQVSQLALVFDERISFTLTDELCLKSIKFLDQAMEGLGESDSEDPLSEINAEFTLMTLEFDNLLKHLSEWFSLGRPVEV